MKLAYRRHFGVVDRADPHRAAAAHHSRQRMAARVMRTFWPGGAQALLPAGLDKPLLNLIGQTCQLLRLRFVIHNPDASPGAVGVTEKGGYLTRDARPRTILNLGLWAN